LEVVCAQFGEEADAAALLAEVDDGTSAGDRRRRGWRGGERRGGGGGGRGRDGDRFKDSSKGLVKLFTTIASLTPDRLARETL